MRITPLTLTRFHDNEDDDTFSSSDSQSPFSGSKGFMFTSAKGYTSDTQLPPRPPIFAHVGSLFFVPFQTQIELSKVGLEVIKRRWCRKKCRVKLLEDVNASISGGEIMAIMGPSGAGKTSLLNCATLNHPKGSVMTGDVKINGQVLTSELFRKHCYIVYQKDFLSPSLTCRETLIFAAKNCIIDEKNKIDSHIDELIQALGLTSCEHTAVGDDFHPGLSGGQKRRLSVCLGLVKMPKFLFLDEPTSGLDAVSAYKTCYHLYEITKKYNIAAVLTIHQPNTKIYDTFTKLMLLKKGKVAYFGESEHAQKYFAQQGWSIPPKTNVADFFLDVMEDETYINNYSGDVYGWKPLISARDKTEKSNTSALIFPKFLTTSFQSNYASMMSVGSHVSNFSLSSEFGYPVLSCRPRPSLWRQTWSTVQKQALTILRDPMLYTGRCLTFAVMSVFFATVYWESRKRTQLQVVPRVWLLLWMVGTPCCMACIVVFEHFQDTVNMVRNVRNGIVRPFAYLFSKLLQIPMMILFSVCSITIGGYVMCNFYGPRYPIVLLVHAVTMLTFELTAELLTVISPNFAIGMLGYMAIWFADFLFSGLLIDDFDVMWPLRAICYVLPLRYGMQAMIYNEYIDSQYSDVSYCSMLHNSTCPIEGFICELDDYACYGHTGDQVLASLHYGFPLITNEDKTLNNILYMLIYCAVVKLLYILRIFWMLRNRG